MAHFAEVDSDNRVIRVIVVDDADTADADGVEVESIGEAFCQLCTGSTNRWIQTSYRTREGTHPDGNPLRHRYAGEGLIYDETNDVFRDTQPFGGAVLNETTWAWDYPTTPPQDGKPYVWDEETESWVERDPTPQELADKAALEAAE